MNASSLSLVARNIRNRLAGDLGLLDAQILIGHPAASAPQAKGQGKQYVNLFFYKVDYDGYPTDGTNNDPFYLRAYCLITAYGSEESLGAHSKITAGENDLRLIGGIMDSLHHRPTIPIVNAASETVAIVQAVPINLTVDDINKIWSTQGDTPYRPSVAYEIGLMPVPVSVARDLTKRIGSIGIGVAPNGTEAPVFSPNIHFLQVDRLKRDWAPLLCLRGPAGELRYTWEVASKAEGLFVEMVILGEPGISIDLHWEVWSNTEGWKVVDKPPVESIAASAWEVSDTKDSASLAYPVALPSSAPGQILVYASRSIAGPNATTIVVRGNTLLISIY